MDIPELNNMEVKITVNYVPSIHAYLDEAYDTNKTVTIDGIDYKVEGGYIAIPDNNELDITVLTKTYILKAFNNIQEPSHLDKFNVLLKKHQQKVVEAVRKAQGK